MAKKTSNSKGAIIFNKRLIVKLGDSKRNGYDIVPFITTIANLGFEDFFVVFSFSLKLI